MFAVLMVFASSSAFAIVYEEDFSDPLGDWVSEWLYIGSNLQNYYVASGTCDDNFRGNEPNGLWVSDDKVCGSLISSSPVTINIDPALGDTAAYFSLDVFACSDDVSLNIYDRNGALDASVQLPNTCFTMNNYAFNLSNGISAFEFDTVSSTVEGYTAIDNVILDTEGRIIVDEDPAPVPTMRSWASALLVMILLSVGLVLLRRRAH
jgi:hypothetical protein